MRTASALCLAAAVLLTAAGCGNGGSDATPGGSAAGSGSSTASGSATPSSGSSPKAATGSRKPCTLVTLQDADSAMGLSMTATATNQDTGVTMNCVYNDNAGHRVQVAMSETAETVAQLDQFQSHDAVRVPGVGDGAYWNLGQATIYVVAHGVGFGIGVFDDHLTMTDAKRQAVATSLARTAVSRL